MQTLFRANLKSLNGMTLVIGVGDDDERAFVVLVWKHNCTARMTAVTITHRIVRGADCRRIGLGDTMPIVDESFRVQCLGA